MAGKLRDKKASLKIVVTFHSFQQVYKSELDFISSFIICRLKFMVGREKNINFDEMAII